MKKPKRIISPEETARRSKAAKKDWARRLPAIRQQLREQSSKKIREYYATVSPERRALHIQRHSIAMKKLFSSGTMREHEIREHKKYIRQIVAKENKENHKKASSKSMKKRWKKDKAGMSKMLRDGRRQKASNVVEQAERVKDYGVVVHG